MRPCCFCLPNLLRFLLGEKFLNSWIGGCEGEVSLASDRLNVLGYDERLNSHGVVGG